jgi:hypothetical protein
MLGFALEDLQNKQIERALKDIAFVILRDIASYRISIGISDSG